MKVALDVGETLDVALVENDRIIGTLSLQLKGLSGASRTNKVTTSAGSEAPNTSSGRKPRRKLSPEARARMAEAQRLRWAKRNASKENANS